MTDAEIKELCEKLGIPFRIFKGTAPLISHPPEKGSALREKLREHYVKKLAEFAERYGHKPDEDDADEPRIVTEE